MATVLKIKGLYKRLNGFTLSDIDLDIEPGQVILLAGRNGAGKTKLIETITCITTPTSGHIKYFDEIVYNSKINQKCLKKNLKKIGVQIQDERLFGSLTVKEIFDTFSTLYGVQNPKKYYSDCNFIKKELGKKIDELSEGKRQLIKFLLSIGHDPELVFLDEPTSFLDGEVRRWTLEKIRQMKKQGTSFLISLNQLWEIGEICDKLILIEKGVLIDKIPNFKSYYEGSVIEISKSTTDLESMEGYLNTLKKRKSDIVFLSKNIQDITELLDKNKGIKEIRKIRIEDFYNSEMEGNT